ncbi:lipopolysaccharide biosynthesis protein [Asticcacaulis sp. YBE204]|uniref:lipopolysaccharide biosynthesis protein n=1 Tax=Asticcacaulis sp. YBE204 TaxID=1282363 RepID=UPI0003C3EEAD|nr:lipopolysaccharide biosynthesis protein [Asticcacaulis sp. YBE204]ESQ76923.1 polysaccharide biosynthesis protein [Asticcacaulis sp. YBE204]
MFWKGLWGYLPANVLQGLIGFATLITFTRILSPEDFGRYALAFGISSLAQTLCFTWIEAAMARFYPAEARENAEAPELYGTLYRLFVVVTLAFAAIVGMGLWLWPIPDAHGQSLKLAVGCGLGVVVFRSLIKMVQEQRRSEGRVGAASFFDMIQTAGGFGFGALLAWGGLGGGSPLLGAGIIAALTLPFVVREDWGRAIKGRFDPVRAKQYAHYGLPLSASLILTLALYTADRFLIAGFLGEAEAGAYHAGYSLASRILDVLFIWFGAAGGPALVHALESGGLPALKDSAREQFRTMALVLFPAVGGLIVVADPLSQLLIGEALRVQALSVTALISVGALFSGFNTYYFLQAFTLSKQTKLLTVAMIVPAVANIGLNVALIPLYGLWGAGMATALSFAIGLIGSWILGRKAIALPVPWVDLLKTAAATGLMMVAVRLIPAFGGIIELIIKGAVGVVVYAGLALTLNLSGVRHHGQRLLKRFGGKVAA